MKINDYIEAAEKKAGKQIELARILGISDSYIRIVKTGRRGFPDDICIQLADYIGADRLEVIAASNLVTEKDERKRKIFESCFSRAATIAIAAGVISVLTLSPTTPVNAGDFSQNLQEYKLLALYEEKNSKKKRHYFKFLR